MSKGIVGKVLSKTYSFPKSRDAMELLRRLTKGESDESGIIGDVWYVRLLPSLREGDFPHVVFCTPYVFRTTGRKHWEEFFARRSARQGDGPGRKDDKDSPG